MPFTPVRQELWTFKRKTNWSDVYWFDFEAPVCGQRAFAGVHPALIVSNYDLILPGTIEIIPLSGIENRRQGYQFHVPITKVDCAFLEKDSIAKVDQVYCVLTHEFPDQYFIGTVTLLIMRRVYSQLLVALGADKFVGS